MNMMNHASIRWQQLGGAIQASVHGSGISISTFDDFVVKLKLLTPIH